MRFTRRRRSTERSRRRRDPRGLRFRFPTSCPTTRGRCSSLSRSHLACRKGGGLGSRARHRCRAHRQPVHAGRPGGGGDDGGRRRRQVERLERPHGSERPDIDLNERQLNAGGRAVRRVVECTGPSRYGQALLTLRPAERGFVGMGPARSRIRRGAAGARSRSWALPYRTRIRRDRPGALDRFRPRAS